MSIFIQAVQIDYFLKHAILFIVQNGLSRIGSSKYQCSCTIPLLFIISFNTMLLRFCINFILCYRLLRLIFSNAQKISKTIFLGNTDNYRIIGCH